MSVIAQETHTYSNLVKQELWGDLAYCREVAVANEAAAKTYAVGTVLGKVTADGKYKIAVQTAVDGSADAAAIVLVDKVVPITTDTKVLTLVRGPAAISKTALVLDASYNLDAEKAVVYAALEAKGILILETA
jgi:uncharacterized protein (UPF0548 family)